MLSEKRHEIILDLLNDKGSITVTELKEILKTSESTIRRDLRELDRDGRLVKVFGGALHIDNNNYTTTELSVEQKLKVSEKEKREIAKMAAGIITPLDFV